MQKATYYDSIYDILEKTKSEGQEIDQCFPGARGGQGEKA